MSTADKKNKYAEALASIEALEARWPKTFFLNQLNRLPLKCGIRDDVIAAGIEMTPGKLSSALRVYCGNRFYLKRLLPNAARIDLNGEPAGFVNSIDARRASDELRRRYAVKAAAAVQADGAGADAPAAVQGAGAPAPATKPAPMAAPSGPRRLSLSDLRTSAMARKAATA
jgi:ProP effector